MIKSIIHYFDKLEDRIRGRLSRYPIVYSIIGGTAVVLFWRGVWITADQVSKILPPRLIWLDGPISTLVSLFILLGTGLFVSFFVNDQIILSGVRQDKKIAEKTEIEVKEEKTEVTFILRELRKLEQEIHNTHIK